MDFGIWRWRRWTIGGFGDNLAFSPGPFLHRQESHSVVYTNNGKIAHNCPHTSRPFLRKQESHFTTRQRRVESAAGGINPLNVFAVATNRTATPSIRTAIPSTRNRRPTQRNRRPMRRNAVNSEVSHQNFIVICRPNWRKFARRIVFYDKFFIFAVVMVKL